MAAAVNDEIPDSRSDAELRSHPLSVWIELEIGLEDKQRLTRRPPTTLTEAAQKLAAATGCDPERCQAKLKAMLILMSKPAERGGTGDRAFLAFKLHQLFSGEAALIRRSGSSVGVSSRWTASFSTRRTMKLVSASPLKWHKNSLKNRAFRGPPTKPSRHKFLLIALKSITVTVDCPQPQC